HDLATWTRSWLPADEIGTLQAKLAAVAAAYGALQLAEAKAQGVAVERLRIAAETTLAASKADKLEQALPSLERLVELEARPARTEYVQELATPLSPAD